jgi:hypothetical protein
LTQPTWEVAGGTESGQRRPGRPPRQAFLQGMGVQDQSSSNRYWSNGASQNAADLAHRLCRTPRRSARSAAGRRAPAGDRPNAPPAGRRPGWRVAGPGRSPWRGPAGAEIAQDFLVTVIVSGDRAAPGHVPGNVICQQAAQVRDVVPTGVEGCLGLVEGLEQPHIGVARGPHDPARPVTNHRGEASAARTAGYPVVGPRRRRGSA